MHECGGETKIQRPHLCKKVIANSAVPVGAFAICGRWGQGCHREMHEEAIRGEVPSRNAKWFDRMIPVLVRIGRQIRAAICAVNNK
jgi:hypothetical protein